MKVIAFGCRKQVGKDSATKFLIHHLRTTRHGINVQKAGFADKLKEICYDLYHNLGLMSADFYDESPELKEIIIPEIGKSPRQVYLEVGQKMREVYRHTWVDYLFSRNYNVLIIKDLRYPDEADRILSYGGQIYRIDRPGSPIVKDGADDQLDNYTKWTDVILNDKDLGSLHDRVIEITKDYIDG